MKGIGNGKKAGLINMEFYTWLSNATVLNRVAVWEPLNRDLD